MVLHDPRHRHNIWVEFEGGNIDTPIWSGCFWAEANARTRLPQVKIIKTQAATITLDEINPHKPRGDQGPPPNNRITITAGDHAGKRGRRQVELSGPQVSVNSGALEVT